MPIGRAGYYAVSLRCDCVLALGSRELMRGSNAIVLPPQVFDLLAYLIRNRERVVSKDELIATIWDGRIVSDGRLTLVPRHAEPGYRAAFRVPVLPGRYLLRIGVADAQGEMGLTEQEVVARLTRIGSYHASDLVVAWVGPDNQLQYPELDEVPPGAVALRTLVELYAAEGKPTVVPRVRLHVEPSAGGDAITRDMDVIVGGTVARARLDIPAPTLPPGEHRIRAVVLEGQRETGTVSTVVRMAAPGPPR